MLLRILALSGICLFSVTLCALAQTAPAAPQPAPPATTQQPSAAAPPATAQQPAAPPAHIRGTIAGIEANKLIITTREGPKVTVTLTQPLSVSSLKRVPLTSISDGNFVGIATRTGTGGKDDALEVLVFPDAMRGVGEGHYPWDLQPGSMMTNAAVSGIAKSKSGRDLTLTYKDGTTTIHVPPRAPIVTIVPAQATDLQPGRQVFIMARPDAQGNLATGRVTVATHGVNPPM